MARVSPIFSIRKTSNGFTFLELIIVLVITAILGTYATVSLNKSILHNQLQKASFEIMVQLSSIRPLALKNDSRMVVRFSSSVCSVYVDTSGDAAVQPEEFSHSFMLNKRVLFGLPSNPRPGTAPPGSQLPLEGNIAAGQWSEFFVVNNDALGTMNSGCIYLYAPKLPGKVYCITSFTSQTLKIYSWNGGTWSVQ